MNYDFKHQTIAKRFTELTILVASLDRLFIETSSFYNLPRVLLSETTCIHRSKEIFLYATLLCVML